MSPPSSRAQARRQRSLVVSIVLVLAVAFGSLAATLAGGWKPLLGLDLAGGFSVVYQPVQKATASDLSETVTILTNRVNGLGVSGATVGTQGNEIVVSVPGVKNSQQVLKTIGQVAQLYFRPTLCYAPPYTKPSAAKGSTTTTVPKALPTSCKSAAQLVTANLKGTAGSGTGVGYTGTPTPTLAAYKSTTVDNPTATVLLPGLTGTNSDRYLLGPKQLTGHIVKKAVAQQTSLGQWVVDMTLTSQGLSQWNAMAKQYFHEVIGIELDGVVQSAPITEPNTAAFKTFSNVQISGHLTQQDAQNLALALNYGSLPIRLKELTLQTVSPTLGSASLKAGLGAGIAGLLLVLLYTIFYYRLLGVVVLSGLVVTAALLWSLISSLGHTTLAPSFDLAGVTGIIVSIGITVDSYIVYFERLKDETRSGRTVRTSVDRGFRSAWRTVLAADLVSLAAAVVLYLVAVGEVKGFAFFLGLSTLMDVFMTYFFTRPLVILLGRNERLAHARGVGMARGLAVDSGAEA
ncbi:MAG: protein translocase subunit SecD [Acidimicrobiales bacterium]